jgi:hypothetical protein
MGGKLAVLETFITSCRYRLDGKKRRTNEFKISLLVFRNGVVKCRQVVTSNMNFIVARVNFMQMTYFAYPPGRRPLRVLPARKKLCNTSLLLANRPH